jgi:hypothetical protein
MERRHSGCTIRVFAEKVAYFKRLRAENAQKRPLFKNGRNSTILLVTELGIAQIGLELPCCTVFQHA